MFDNKHIPYWAHEVAKPTKQPGRTEKMLVRIHTQRAEEEACVRQMAESQMEFLGRHRTEEERAELFSSVYRDCQRFFGGSCVGQRIASAKARHPVCTNKANGAASNGVPLTRKATVWHIGDLTQLCAKRTGENGSHEGPGLPVSECPVAWNIIAGSAGMLWRLSRHDGEFGRFVDYYALIDTQRDAYRKEALQQRLVKQVTKWRINFVDEDGEPMFNDFSSREDAEKEIDGEDTNNIEKVEGYVATPKLDKLWQRFFTRSLVECDPKTDHGQLAILALLMDEELYDGVWWYEDYNPEGDSAPRGVIFPTRIKDWKLRREGEASNASYD